MWRLLTRFRLLFAGYIALVALVSAVVWWVADARALDQLEARAASDLALAGDGLQNELAQYRSLAVVVAEHPFVTDILASRVQVGQADTLLELADKTGALDIMVVGLDGRELASAAGQPAILHSTRPYFNRAMHGGLGVYHLLSDRYKRRTFLFAVPVFGADGPVAGAVIVAADVEAIEASWRGDRPSVFFTDELGVIFISSRSEMVLRSLTGDIAAAGQSAEYKSGDVAPFRAVDQAKWRGHTIWRMDGRGYLPDDGLHLRNDLPVIGLAAEVLLDVRPARQIAATQAGAAGAFGGAIGLVLFWLLARRQSLAAQNQQLEGRVLRRTAELQTTNANLQKEVAERREAQAALTQAQEELVQAGKLSALGQMSAGISHELNQPLMAIQSFSENAKGFLDRDRPDVAAQNLNRISELAHRMGRIIRSLRVFARQDQDAIRPIDLSSVVDEVVDMTAARMAQEGVALDRKSISAPLWVRGGDVRLQQVVLNLVTNALDAMEGQDNKRLDITVATQSAQVVLTVRDTGPGLAAPEKVFEPFYSTKQLPQQEGMGLGLSISYGLVQSFGGDILGYNHPDGGAVFEVTLDAALPDKDVA